MSSGSGSGSGADQHLLALLRAIRLRQAAPDAVSAGATDTAAALTELDRLASQEDGDEPLSSDISGASPGVGSATRGPAVRPGWAAAADEHESDDISVTGDISADEGFRSVSGERADGDLTAANGEVANGDHVHGGHTRGGHVHGDHTQGDHTQGDQSDGAAIRMPGKDFFGRPKPPPTSPDPGTDLLPGEVDEVGRPNRNLFAGLTPTRKPPQPPSTDEPGVPPTRPLWASGDGGAQPTGVHKETPYVAPGRRFVVSSDGMDPADDALLRETQRLLSTSLTYAGGPDEVAARFREALLQAHPALVAILPGGEPTQNELLARAITWLVHNLDQPPVLVDGCAKLGAALDASGVRPDELRMVGAALVEAIRAGMPPGTWRQDFDVAWRSTWQHVYEWIRHGEITHATEAGIWDAIVVEHDLRRHDLAVVKFRPLLPMPYEPGQYARIEVSELPGIWRPYSLAGAPRRNDILELHVRAKTQSGVSGTLVYRTREGDLVRFGRAEGAMTLPPPPGRDLLMIAGDTGVAPLKALLTELVDTGDPRSAVLFWGVRNLDELYDVDDLTEIARSGRRITVVPVVSEGNPGPYASGLVMDAVAAYGEWSRHEVYLAGPPIMLEATKTALYQLGVDPSRIHHDEPE